MIGTEIHNFNTLYTKFYRKSFLFTKSYVHDECIAEDIVSDVLIKLWEILKEKEIEHIEALLLTTLKNKSLDHLKHEAVKTEALRTLTDMRQRELDIRISTLEACNPEDIFSTEVQQIVTATLALLPERQLKFSVFPCWESGAAHPWTEYHKRHSAKIFQLLVT